MQTGGVKYVVGAFVLAALLSGAGFGRAQANGSFAQTSNDVLKWESRLQSLSLEELAELLRTEAWPRVNRESRTLSQNLFEKIIEFENRQDWTSLNGDASLRDGIAVYGSLSAALDRPGGYYNWVVADALNRLNVSHLGSTLVNQPKQSKEVRESIGVIKTPFFGRESIVRLLEEQDIPDARRRLREKDGAELLEGALGLLGIRGPDEFNRVEEGRYTSYLLTKVDCFTLLMRLLETDLLSGVHLHGALSYVEAGGDFEAIRLDDVRPFNRLLGGARDQFRNEYFGVKRLYASHVDAIVDEFRRPLTDSAFYRIAVK